MHTTATVNSPPLSIFLNTKSYKHFTTHVQPKTQSLHVQLFFENTQNSNWFPKSIPVDVKRQSILKQNNPKTPGLQADSECNIMRQSHLTDRNNNKKFVWLKCHWRVSHVIHMHKCSSRTNLNSESRSNDDPKGLPCTGRPSCSRSLKEDTLKSP